MEVHVSFVRIEIDGKMKSGYILREGSNYWFHHDGRTFLIEDDNARSAKKAQKGSNPLQVVAPMPGKIIKTFAAPGKTVKAGDVVVVMEAMKMEYSLKAETTGIVRSVNCKEGDQVTQGKLLVQLTEAK
jgi:acetyl/propionyl-CoA carboxylase alpha subunit